MIYAKPYISESKQTKRSNLHDDYTEKIMQKYSCELHT